jgi:ribulose-phosphate 3-epimerase
MTAPTLAGELQNAAPLISAGMISADLMHLADAAQALAEGGCRLLHFDVMDGRFCPQLTAGPFFVKGVTTPLLKDVHLMVEDPLPLIPEFAAAGADLITVHAESGRHAHRALQCIAEQKNAHHPDRPILRGIALNPGTPCAALEPFLDETDLIVLLAVNPGFPKQKFIGTTARRFASLKALLAARGRSPLLCIDGGITRENIAMAASLGPHCLVTGSALFAGGGVRQNLALLHGEMRKGTNA